MFIIIYREREVGKGRTMEGAKEFDTEGRWCRKEVG